LATVEASTNDPQEAVDLINRYDPDMLFLDIRMPGMSGFDILNELRRLNTVSPHVVFTTAHDEYAIKAFDYAAFDYLLKPIDPDRLQETLQRFRQNDHKGASDRSEALFGNERILIFRGVTGVTFIDPADVMFISADGNYSNFNFISGRIETVTSLLGALEMHLGKLFFRTGRSCIVNTSYLSRIDLKQMQCVFIRGDREFRCEISRDKVKLLMDHMKTRFAEN
ncbi:MAG: LytR/AlgR family response regulator transcription factor, partial [Bacteroidales bacterium]